MQINPLSDALGAEVVGLDVVDIDDATLRTVRKAWLDHLVLVFRDQKLTPERHIAFSRGFGELEVHIATDHLLDGYPEIMMVSNKKENGRYIGAVSAGDYWHSDLSCKALPSMGSLLYALELPSVGGDTAFANQYTAYETLPEATKRRIAGLRGVHTFNRMRNPRVEVPEMHRGDAHIRYGERAPDDGVHPIVRTHPETGRKALYVSPRFTVGIEGMEDEEAQPLLDDLFEHQDNKSLKYRHKWRLGDLVMWDNRCTTHFACRGFPENEIRHMHRTTIAGDMPF